MDRPRAEIGWKEPLVSLLELSESFFVNSKPFDDGFKIGVFSYEVLIAREQLT